MQSSIGSKIETPLFHLQAYTYKYNRTEEPDDKAYWESLIVAILQALVKLSDKLDIKKLSKEAALETLKDIDGFLDTIERDWDLLNEDSDLYPVPIREAMFTLYNRLDDLSIALSVYLNDETSQLLERMQNGDFSDFEPYEVSE